MFLLLLLLLLFRVAHAQLNPCHPLLFVSNAFRLQTHVGTLDKNQRVLEVNGIYFLDVQDELISVRECLLRNEGRISTTVGNYTTLAYYCYENEVLVLTNMNRTDQSVFPTLLIKF
jgi:hypothetical protein